MAIVTVKDELIQEAIAWTKLAYPRVPATEVIVEEALKAFVKRMTGLPELVERIRSSPRMWGWDEPSILESEEQPHVSFQETLCVDEFNPLTHDEVCD